MSAGLRDDDAKTAAGGVSKIITGSPSCPSELPRLQEELLGGRLCRLGLYHCRVRQQPIQDDGRAPGLVGGA